LNIRLGQSKGVGAQVFELTLVSLRSSWRHAAQSDEPRSSNLFKDLSADPLTFHLLPDDLQNQSHPSEHLHGRSSRRVRPSPREGHEDQRRPVRPSSKAAQEGDGAKAGTPAGPPARGDSLSGGSSLSASLPERLTSPSEQRPMSESPGPAKAGAFCWWNKGSPRKAHSARLRSP
jgi:hypothetical protein